MNDIDDIVSDKNFNKEDWIKKKQDDRKKAYELIDKTALEIVSDSSKFKLYLDVLSRLDKYSVGNGLLIMSQMPNATQLKEFSDWKELGAYIKKNEQSITILEPGEPYMTKDGIQKTSYNPKKVFDISQTTFKSNVKRKDYDDKTKLTALLKDCPISIKAVDDINGSNLIATWNKEDNTLYVKRGEDTSILFKEISREIAKTMFEETGNIDLKSFKCNCVSYILSKKYNFNISSIDIDTIPASLKNMSSNEIRNELSTIKNIVEDVNTRMNSHFELITKQTKNREQER